MGRIRYVDGQGEVRPEASGQISIEAHRLKRQQRRIAVLGDGVGARK
jgi:hypothetical protein